MTKEMVLVVKILVSLDVFNLEKIKDVPLSHHFVVLNSRGGNFSNLELRLTKPDPSNNSLETQTWDYWSQYCQVTKVCTFCKESPWKNIMQRKLKLRPAITVHILMQGRSKLSLTNFSLWMLETGRPATFWPWDLERNSTVSSTTSTNNLKRRWVDGVPWDKMEQ